MELDAELIEVACISDFKMLMLASETSIYARTADINCLVFGTQFKRAEEVKLRYSSSILAPIIEKTVEKTF